MKGSYLKGNIPTSSITEAVKKENNRQNKRLYYGKEKKINYNLADELKTN